MKYFKLSNIRRFIILGVTMIATILTITFGSTFYISKNAKKSIEYGGGAEYLVKVNAESSTTSSGTADQIAQEIYERINKLGISGASAIAETSNGESRIRVRYPGITSKKEEEELKKLITKKPILTLTDTYGNPLFDQYQNFHNELSAKNPKHQIPSDSKSFVPLANGGAKGQTNNSGGHEVAIHIVPEKVDEWRKATEYISSLPKGKKTMVVWLNLKEFIFKAKSVSDGHGSNLFDANGKNAYLAAKYKYPEKGWNPVNRKFTLQTKDFLISEANVSKPLTGTDFVIQGNFDSKEANNLAKKINYGILHYSLKVEEFHFIGATYGDNAFKKAMIAGIIVFALIGIFLIVNYGVLGAVSTFAIAFYMFIIISLFTIMKGEFSPEAIAALIIGVGMAVDANIITYERLKSEVYSGSSIKKGFKDANKKSLSSIFDSNITTLIVAFVLFFFGTRNIIGLSVTLILSIVFTLIIMLGFTRVFSTMLVKTGIFENRRHLLGMKPKFDIKVQESINKIDYVGTAKWFTLGSSIILFAGLLTLAITAGIAGHFAGGFNLSQDFTGGTSIMITPEEGVINKDSLKQIHQAMIDHNIPIGDIKDIMSKDGVVRVEYKTTSAINDLEGLQQAIENLKFKFTPSTVSNAVAKKILFDAMIAVAISIGAIVVYTMFRFKWTYSIAAIIALLHDALMVVAIFVIFRVEISPVFIAGLLSIIGYSINDTIVTFDRLREKMNEHVGILDKKAIKKITNVAIRETLKRSLLTSFTTIVAVIVLMSFGNATKMSFNLSMLVGLITGTYSSIFIATYIWVILETKRQKSIISKKGRKFWDTDGEQEQVFIGINDFKE